MSALPQEAERLATLHSLELLDTPPEREFDAIAGVARTLFRAPVALISLVDDHRQWFKAKLGTDLCETAREHAFCSVAIGRNDLLLVPDALQDPLFVTNAMVTGDPHIRFYAGAPIRARHPHGTARLPIGTLCVFGPEPRSFDAGEQRALRDLATVAEALVDARATAIGATRLAARYEEAVQQLDRSHRIFLQAERMAQVGAWRLQLDDRTLYWSDQTFAIHGLPPGKPPAVDAAIDFYDPASRPLVQAAIDESVATGKPWDIEADLVDAAGRKRRVRSMGEVQLKDGAPHALVGVFQDVTERHAREQLLREQAETDELTRIASRSHFNAHLDGAIARAQARGTGLALLLLDLDHFKAVNDRCGHAVGDDLLRIMAKRLRAPYLESSFAARLGGDEFVMVITCPDLLADLPRLLRRMLPDLRHTVRHNALEIRVSATIGAAWLNAETATRSALLQRADEALYAAKHRQRGAAMIAGEDALIHPVRRSEQPRLRLAS